MILARQSIFAHVFFIGIFVTLLLVPLLASAANPTTSFLVPEGCKAGCPCTLCDLYTLGSNVINFALYALSVPIAAAMFLYGGVKLVTSGGNPGARTSAKSIMVNAVIGMALAFFAWLVINTLLITLTFQINFVEGLKMWNETPTCKSGGGETCNVTGFVVPPPPATGPTAPPTIPTGGQQSHEGAYDALANAGIQVCSTAYGCTPANRTCTQSNENCTYLGGLNQGTIDHIIEVNNNCRANTGSNCVIITGGTEDGHTSHGTNHPNTVDMRYDPSAITALQQNGYGESNFGRGYTCESSPGVRTPCNSGNVHHIHVEF